jgi:hypothetical protein
MFNTFVGAGAGAASRYGSGSATLELEANTCVALPNAYRRSVARTFSTVITTSVVQNLNEKSLALIV